LVENSEKDHHRLIGLETQFMDSIYKNDDLQKSIKDLMQIPGPKKSVSMNVPYLIAKTGKKYPLIRMGIDEPAAFQKSEGKPKSFKEFWKTEKSTLYDNTPGLDG